jgi:hypothetical protein
MKLELRKIPLEAEIIVDLVEKRGVRFQVVYQGAAHKQLRVPIGDHRLSPRDRAQLEIQEKAIIEYLEDRLRRGVEPPIVCADCGDAGHIDCGMPF